MAWRTKKGGFLKGRGGAVRKNALLGFRTQLRNLDQGRGEGRSLPDMFASRERMESDAREEGNGKG